MSKAICGQSVGYVGAYEYKCNIYSINIIEHTLSTFIQKRKARRQGF